MAQRRMIHRRITESEKVQDLRGNDRARFIYVALLPYTDREGRINVNPHGLKGTLFEPFEYTVEDIHQALLDLAGAGLLTLYRSRKHDLLAVYEKFREFNTPHPNEHASDFPPPEDPRCELVAGRPPESFGKPSESLPKTAGTPSDNARNEGDATPEHDTDKTDERDERASHTETGTPPEGARESFGKPSESVPKEAGKPSENPPKSGGAGPFHTHTPTPTQSPSQTEDPVSSSVERAREDEQSAAPPPDAHESGEARFDRRMRNGSGPELDEVNRVRATLRRLAGRKFVVAHEDDLAAWARWSDDDLKRLWDASDLEKWPKERAAGKRRTFILEDLLNEDRLPPTPAGTEGMTGIGAGYDFYGGNS